MTQNRIDFENDKSWLQGILELKMLMLQEDQSLKRSIVNKITQPEFSIKNRAAAVEAILRTAQGLDYQVVLLAIDMFDSYYASNNDLNQKHYVDEKKLTALVSLQMFIKELDQVPAKINDTLESQLNHYRPKIVTNRYGELVRIDVNDSFAKTVKLGYLERFIKGIEAVLRI